ncbi:hypothetical protein [Labilibaculum sp.]|uniref:hypothetical protein n=1 Tax=Labilibaculum sp. TaxID=2060723 RepID=UPI0035650F02
MKRILLIFGLTLFINFTYSQTINITESEFTGVIVYVNDTIGEGIKLEQQTISTSTRANAASFVPVVGFAAGKSKSKNIVKGSSSSVKLNNNNKLQFIVKVANNSVDPSTILNIFKLSSNRKKNIRTLKIGSYNAIGGSKSGNINYIPFSAKKYGENSYLIQIDNIESGEYAMTLVERRDLFHMFCIE